jgi:hypothetical protein
MKKKAFQNNAQQISCIGRTVFGFFLGLFFVFCLGFLFSSWVLGLVMLTMSLVFLPLFYAIRNYFLFRRSRFSIRGLKWSQHPDLADEYLRLLLWKSGPNPEIWLRDGQDASFIYYGIPWGFWNREILVVSTGWIELGLAKQILDLENFWDCTQKLSETDKRIWGLQMMVWATVVAPINLLASLAQYAFDSLGFRELPTLTFWLGVPLKFIKKIWFGTRMDLQSAWEESSARAPKQKSHRENFKERPRLRMVSQGLDITPWVFENSVDKHALWEWLQNGFAAEPKNRLS